MQQNAATVLDEAFARELIADHLAVPADEVHDNALFQHDLGADSLDIIELTMLFETEFGIEIGDDESEPCLTVGAALQLLRDKTAAR